MPFDVTYYRSSFFPTWVISVYHCWIGLGAGLAHDRTAIETSLIYPGILGDDEIADCSWQD